MNNTKKNPIDTIRELEAQLEQLKTSEVQLQVLNKKLKESEDKYRSIFENTGTITLIFEEDTTISMINSDFARLMGYSKKEVEGKMSWTEFIARDDLPKLIKSHYLRIKNPALAPRNHEFKVINKNGDMLYIFMTIDIIPGTTQRIASLIDVSDRVRAESEIIRISERERQTIGQDLHDDLAPQLIGIEVLVKVLEKKLESRVPEELESIKKIRTLIRDAISMTRRFARGLYPIHIVDHGIASSLKELAIYTEEVYNRPCSFTMINETTPGDSINDITISTNLYYLVQEAVHNAVKHGRAERIEISMTNEADRTVITVVDDGTGFKAEEKPQGMGLKIMEYRAKLIGALLEVSSEQGCGTKVTVTLQNSCAGRSGQ